MRNIIDYKGVTTDNMPELNKKVNDLISKGWKPFGSLCTAMVYNGEDEMCHYVNTQAMVRYEDGSEV